MKGFIVEENGETKTLMLSDKAALKINNLIIYNRSEILVNRKKWIDFLMTKGRKKATGKLDAGGGARCCLGHACYALGIKSKLEDDGIIYYDETYELAPDSVVEMLGLWSDDGSTKGYDYLIDVFGKGDIASTHSDLASVNDETKASPLVIGRYLLSVIEGGEKTPFRPLTDYPE